MVDSPPNDVRPLIEGRAEREITAEVQRLGIDAVLSRVFGLIAGAFIPEAAALEFAVVQFDITAPDGVRCYQLRFAEQKCVVVKAGCDDPRLTISLPLALFLRIVGGEVEGLHAFVSGRLRLSGDVLLAQAMRGWFKQEPVVAVAI
jgi:putative sterol carrier protein